MNYMKNLLTVIFSVILTFSFAPFQNAASQTEDKEAANEEKKSLRSDLKVSDVVAYVNIKQTKNVDRLGGGNCETNVGSGYCLYLLTAEIKEFFKGKTAAKTLEFYISTETSYPKKNLLGEKIVFLVWNENAKMKHLSAIENSSRSVKLLAEMRKIADVKTPVNETDESDPYSLASIRKDFESADAVIYADVKSFREDAEDLSYQEFVLQAEAVEVLKGSFKTGEKIEYLDDLTYRAFNQSDLGKQVIFLERKREGGKTFYTRIKNTADFERNNLLEKLRKISAQKPKTKSSANSK